MKCHINRLLTGFLIVIITGFISCKPDNQAKDRISLQLELHQSGHKQVIWLEELKIHETLKIDSFTCESDIKKTVIIKTDKAGFYILRNNMGQLLTLQLEPGENVILQADAGNFQKQYSVTGSDGSELLKRYSDESTGIAVKYDSLKEVFKVASEKGYYARIRQGLDSAYSSLVSEQRLLAEKLIRGNASSLSAIFLLNQKFGPQLLFDEKKDIALFELVDTSLIKKYRNNEHVMDHHNRVSLLLKEQKLDLLAEKQLVKGKKAPAIILADLAGKQISLNEFYGKPLLVYFWQSADAMSRKENISLNRFCQSAKHDIPALLCVSMDSEPEMTKAAVKIDGLPGIHLNDPTGISGKIASMYNLKGKLPRYFLIDSQGDILAHANSIDNIREKF